MFQGEVIQSFQPLTFNNFIEFYLRALIYY